MFSKVIKLADKLTQQIGFRTTDEIKKLLEERAAYEDRSISYIVNKALKDYFQKIEEAKTLLNK